MRVCVYCGNEIVRRVNKNGTLEWKRAFESRKYCGRDCKFNQLEDRNMARGGVPSDHAEFVPFKEMARRLWR